jgi:PAS domain S-box-containing protein
MWREGERCAAIENPVRKRGDPSLPKGSSWAAVPLSAEQYQRLVECAPTLIWRSGRDARCDYFNETWLTFTGRRIEDELGDGWAEGVHPDDFARCVSVYRDHFDRREPFEMQYRLRRHDGVYRTILDRGVPYSDDRGEFAGFIGSCVDVDERVQAERARTTFLSLLGHELRTPLTALKGFIEAIRSRVAQRRPIEPEIVGRLGAQADRLANLVGELLDHSHLSDGRELPLSRAELDLSELTRQVVEHFAEISTARGERHHAFEARTGDLPAIVIGDAARLQQVLLNLLDNAMKYSPSGGLVLVTLRTDGSEHVLTVADEGIGVPAAELPRVTERYFRASNAPAENFPGIGVGLALSREIVERHAGRIEVASELGKGTTVAVHLPASRPARHSPDAAAR